MKHSYFLLALLATGACTDAVTTPTPDPPPTATAAVVSPDPVVLPALPVSASWTVREAYPCGATTRPSGIYRWTVDVADSGPTTLRVIAIAFHDETAGCNSTLKHPRDVFGVSGKARPNRTRAGNSCSRTIRGNIPAGARRWTRRFSTIRAKRLG